MILRLRRDYRMTAAEIAAALHLPRSTVAGLGRLAALDLRPVIVRYQRQRPGELLHIDVNKLARFERVGHRITGNRRGRSDGVGWDFVHVAVDDASRLADVEVRATSGAPRSPASWSARFAGSGPVASASSG